jgi:aspartokinase
MITISQVVKMVLNNKPFIIEVIQDDIIKKEVESIAGRTVNSSAIIMALRRINPEEFQKISFKLESIIKRLGDITVRSNLVDYTFRNSDSLISKHQKMLSKFNNESDLFFTISQGVYETTFVISDKLKGIIPDIFEGEKLISFSSGLSSITIKLPKENIELPGLYYFIFRKLAWDGINILEVISTSNEFTIILKDQDIDKAFSVIKKIKI